MARLTGPEAYRLTAETAVRSVERIVDGQVTPGFHTPAEAFGAGFIEEVPGVVAHAVELHGPPGAR